MKRLLLSLSLIYASTALASESTLENLVYAGTTQASTFTASALAKADVAYARSILAETQLKGIVGESLAANSIEKEFLSKGGWKAITPRAAAQGIDHLYIKYNKNNIPCDLLVAETKFGSSKLGMTKDGKQASSKWYSTRLRAVASRYNDFSANTAIELNAKKTLTTKGITDIPLKNGKTVSFWRANNKTYFSGSQAELNAAKQSSKDLANYINAAANDKIAYRSKIYYVEPSKNGFDINIKDAKQTSTANISTKSHPSAKLHINANTISNSKSLSTAVASQIKTKMPHISDGEARLIAKDTSKNIRNLITPQGNIHTRILGNSIKGAGITTLLIASEQLIFEGKVDTKSLAFGLASGLAIQGAQYTTLAMQRTGYVSFLNRPLAAGVTSSLLTAPLAYLPYFMGYADITQANTLAVVSVASAGIATVAGAGTMGLVATFGTAGTGTAISTLSGAAATNATLAWIEGGTVAAGGGGVAVGSAIMTGGVAIIAIGLSYGIMKGVSWYTDKEMYNSHMSVLSELRSNDSFLESSIQQSF